MVRKNCVLSGSELTEIFKFKNFPIRMGKSQRDDIKTDMIFSVSDCGLVQLQHLICPELLYTDFHNPGAMGSIWEEHHKKFSSFISPNKTAKILEIGGSSGSLANFFRDYNWSIIDPDENIKCEANHIKGFFETYDFSNQYDTIIHSHTLEHVYDPKLFLTKIRNLLSDDGLMYISIPNMHHWLQNYYPNTLHFEHTYYLDFSVLKNLLSLTGFIVKNYEISDHSIFVSCFKSTIDNTINDFSYSKILFFNYINHLKHELYKINEIIKDTPVFLFGANIFSQILINLGLPEDQIINIIDNDATKQNNCLYGTNIKVVSPDILSQYSNPLVIVKAGVYSNEISAQLSAINPNLKLIL